MNAEWQKKLTSFGLEEQGGDFVYPAAATESDVLCTLASDTILHVSGDDAEAFLQGQFSNDIAALESPGSQLSTWSSPKGRVITMLRVVRIEDGYLIKLPQALLEPVLKRLRMYASLPILTDNTVPKVSTVVVEPRDDLIAIGISGDSAVKVLGATGVKAEQEIDKTTVLGDEAWITRVRGEAHRFEMIGTVERIAELWGACMAGGCEMADESVWRLQNIDAGIPSIDEKTTEAFVLQMLNLQHINGVSFKKGCFPGQEVVARMQYLGKLKRQMFRLGYEGDTVPVAGDEIYKAGGGSAAGKVVDAACIGNNASRLLAVMAIDATSEPLFLDKEATQPLQLLTMPYETAAAE